MIDLSREKLVPLKVKSKLLPIEGNPPCYEAIRQRMVHGVRGVKLESVTIGRRKYRSKQAVDRFWEAISPTPLTATVPGIVDLKSSYAARERIRQKHGL